MTRTSTMIGLSASASLMMLVALVEVRSETPELCMDDAMRERVRGVVLEGLDLALKDRTKQTFDIWMKDQSDQPMRAIAGMRANVSAYVRSRNTVMSWNPPLCKQGVEHAL
jgi:hypothetical protein